MRGRAEPVGLDRQQRGQAEVARSLHGRAGGQLPGQRELRLRPLPGPLVECRLAQEYRDHQHHDDNRYRRGRYSPVAPFLSEVIAAEIILVDAEHLGGNADDPVLEFFVAAFRGNAAEIREYLRLLEFPGQDSGERVIRRVPVEVPELVIPADASVRENDDQVIQPGLVADPVGDLTANPWPGSRRRARDQHQVPRVVKCGLQASPERATDRHRGLVQENPHRTPLQPSAGDVLQAVLQLPRYRDIRVTAVGDECVVFLGGPHIRVLRHRSLTSTRKGAPMFPG